MLDPIIVDLGLGLGLGLLIGFEREWSADDEVAGVRTFALVALLGVIAGQLALTAGAWILAVGLAAVTTLLVIGNLGRYRKGDIDTGMTTEMAALVVYGLAAFIPFGFRVQAVAAAGSVAALLHLKQTLHGWIRGLDAGGVRAVVRLGLLALVIAPLLPDRPMGPFGVLNPFKIWLMVVLIEAITLTGWIVARAVGPRAGVLAAGALGGLISSTATTVSASRSARHQPRVVAASALIVAMASAVVYARVSLEVVIVAPGIARTVLPPLLLAGLALVVAAALAARRGWKGDLQDQGLEAPSTLGAAISFGLLYAAVLVAVAYARNHLGSAGLYAVAALSGLTDMDAITLSTARMSVAGQIPPTEVWRLILVGSLANLSFKAGIAAVVGGREVFVAVARLLAVGMAASVMLLLLWP